MPLLFLIAYPLFAWYLFNKTKNKAENIPGNIKFLGSMSFVFLYLFTLYNIYIVEIFSQDNKIMYLWSFIILFLIYIFTFFYYKSKYKNILEEDIDFYLNQPYISKKDFIFNLIYFLVPFGYFLFSIFFIFTEFRHLGNITEVILGGRYFRFWPHFIMFFAIYYIIAGVYGFFITIDKYNKQRIINKVKKEFDLEEKIKNKLSEKNLED